MVETYQCHCFLVVGTSAQVYPAAGLVSLARSQGAKVVEVNLHPTGVSDAVDVCLHGPSGQILPRLVERVRR
jgi:NAD-dependent deacetylase